MTNKEAAIFQGEDYFEEMKFYTKNYKKLALYVLGAFLEKIPKGFVNEQEIMSALSDILIGVYTTESAVLRAEKIESMKSKEFSAYAKAMTENYLYDTSFSIRKSAYDAVNSFLKGDELQNALNIIDKLSVFKPLNIREIHRFIADKIIDENKYCF